MLCHVKNKGEEEIKDCFMHTVPVEGNIYCGCCEKVMSPEVVNAGYLTEDRGIWNFQTKSRVLCKISLCVTCSHNFRLYGCD